MSRPRSCWCQSSAAAVVLLLAACNTDGSPGAEPETPTTSTTTAAATTATATSTAEPGTVERFVAEVRARTGPDGVPFDDAYREFRELAATDPLDAATAAAAGELADDVYLPMNAASRYGAAEIADLYARTRAAALAVTSPATPEMVRALDAVLAEWAPYLDPP